MKQTLSIVILLTLILPNIAAQKLSPVDRKLKRILVGEWKGDDSNSPKLKTFVFSKNNILTVIVDKYTPQEERIYVVKNQKLIIQDKVISVKILTRNLLELTIEKQKKIILTRK